MKKEKMLIKGAYEFLGVKPELADSFAKDIVEREGLKNLKQMTIEDIVDIVAKQIKVDLKEEFIGGGYADDIYKQYTELKMCEIEIKVQDDLLKALLDELSLYKELEEVGVSNIERLYKNSEIKIDSLMNLKKFLESDVLNYLNNIESNYSNISIYAKEKDDVLHVKISYIKNYEDVMKLFRLFKVKSIQEVRDIVVNKNIAENAYLWLNRGDICIKIVYANFEADVICVNGMIEFYRYGGSLSSEERINLIPKELIV